MLNGSGPIYANTPPLNKRRLTTLAELLEVDAKKKKGVKFDMRTWGRIKDPTKPLSCGTQACAMGLAALSGKFKRAGLRFRLNSDNGVRVFFEMKDAYAEDGFEAAQLLFGLTWHESRYLFASRSYTEFSIAAVTERAVAKRIRKLIEDRNYREVLE